MRTRASTLAANPTDEEEHLEPRGDARAWVGLLVLTPLEIQGASGSPLRASAPAP